jgi:hypothetical protein
MTCFENDNNNKESAVTETPIRSKSNKLRETGDRRFYAENILPKMDDMASISNIKSTLMFDKSESMIIPFMMNENVTRVYTFFLS